MYALWACVWVYSIHLVKRRTHIKMEMNASWLVFILPVIYVMHWHVPFWWRWWWCVCVHAIYKVGYSTNLIIWKLICSLPVCNACSVYNGVQFISCANKDEIRQNYLLASPFTVLSFFAPMFVFALAISATSIMSLLESWVVVVYENFRKSIRVRRWFWWLALPKNMKNSTKSMVFQPTNRRQNECLWFYCAVNTLFTFVYYRREWRDENRFVYSYSCMDQVVSRWMNDP